jgi:hypothetical protein
MAKCSWVGHPIGHTGRPSFPEFGNPRRFQEIKRPVAGCDPQESYCPKPSATKYVVDTFRDGLIQSRHEANAMDVSATGMIHDPK